MLNIIRTNSTNVDFIDLVKLLDADLAIRDGDEHAFYSQYNKLDLINHVLVFYENNIAVGCGALKQYNENAMEVKRMFTLPESRGKGIAVIVLNELEKWAKELGYAVCILETGVKQHEAIALYTKCKYNIIPNYGQYINADNSFCFQKNL